MFWMNQDDPDLRYAPVRLGGIEGLDRFAQQAICCDRLCGYNRGIMQGEQQTQAHASPESSVRWPWCVFGTVFAVHLILGILFFPILFAVHRTPEIRAWANPLMKACFPVLLPLPALALKLGMFRSIRGYDAIKLLLFLTPFCSLLWSFTVADITHWVRCRQMRRKARLVGLCRTCGYDLRASKDRCPECGSPILSDLPEEPAN
jgi:hypothetical protein